MKKICIIFSNDILLESVKYISDIISSKYELYYLYISEQNKFYSVKNFNLLDTKYEITNILDFKKYDIIFPLTTKPVKGLLEIFNINYVGTCFKNDIICRDKVLFKNLMKSYKIRQIKYITVYKEDKYQKVKKLIKYKLGYPCFIKNSTIKYKVESESNLKKLLEKAFIYDNKLVVEKNIKGKNNNIYMYNKILLNKIDNKKLLNKINNVSKIICDKLECNELINISFIITKYKKVYLNDVSTLFLLNNNIINSEIIDNIINI